jgi:hypothetical protein
MSPSVNNFRRKPVDGRPAADADCCPACQARIGLREHAVSVQGEYYHARCVLYGGRVNRPG